MNYVIIIRIYHFQYKSKIKQFYLVITENNIIERLTYEFYSNFLNIYYFFYIIYYINVKHYSKHTKYKYVSTYIYI